MYEVRDKAFEDWCVTKDAIPEEVINMELGDAVRLACKTAFNAGWEAHKHNHISEEISQFRG